MRKPGKLQGAEKENVYPHSEVDTSGQVENGSFKNPIDPNIIYPI